MNFTIYNHLKRTLLIIVLCTAILLAATLTAWAYARGYVSQDQELTPGMTAALSQSSTAEVAVVERANQDNPQMVVGVATVPEENTVTVASGTHQVYIQSIGSVKAFVSNVNGELKKGDSLTVSPILGVLMRANSGSRAIGTALEDFSNENAESHVITTDEGNKTVLISELNISLANSLSNGQEFSADTEEASALEKLGKAITGKEIGEFQIITALVIFLVVMIAEGSIIYGAISSSIISLGRNPFSKNMIRKELVRVLLLAVFVLLIGLASMYAVLRI